MNTLGRVGCKKSILIRFHYVILGLKIIIIIIIIIISTIPCINSTRLFWFHEG
jgi:hypothetical protein